MYYHPMFNCNPSPRDLKSQIKSIALTMQLVDFTDFLDVLKYASINERNEIPFETRTEGYIKGYNIILCNKRLEDLRI